MHSCPLLSCLAAENPGEWKCWRPGAHHHCKINAIPFDFLLSRRRSSANAVLPPRKKTGHSPKSANSGYCISSAPDIIHRQKELQEDDWTRPRLRTVPDVARPRHHGRKIYSHLPRTRKATFLKNMHTPPSERTRGRPEPASASPPRHSMPRQTSTTTTTGTMRQGSEDGQKGI